MAPKNEIRVDDRYIRPKAAEKKFELAQKLRQTVYLCGITGTGKTALVRDMLQSSDYLYFPAEETGPERLEAPEDGTFHILVVDGLEKLQCKGEREAYAKCLRTLSARRDVWLVLISRCRIPNWLMPLHMENAFLVIEEQDFQFDRPGQDAYLEAWNIRLDPKAADQLWTLAGGRPLFLRFVALAGGDLNRAVGDMWNYLYQLYDQWDPEIQEFVLEMSVVERFDIRMAQMVTGRSDAQRILKKAMEAGNFYKEKDGMYELDSGFRSGIQMQLERKFDRDRLARLYYNAGHMYEMYGDIPRALGMYEAGEDNDSIFRLLVANARHNPASGRYFELRRYYLLLPEESVRTSPVLMAGMSMLQSILLNCEESERWYRQLKEFSEQSGGSERREAKNWLLYLDIGLPHRGSVGMVELMKYAGSLLKEGKTALPEFSVTSNLPSTMNGGKDFCEWSKRDRELAASIGKIMEFVLGRYGKGLVSVCLAESCFEKGIDTYEVVSLAEKGRMQAAAGGKTQMVFAAVGVLIWLSVINGMAADAQDILESFRESVQGEAPQLLLNLNALRCRVCLYQGKTPEILEWMEEAPDENGDFCTLERLRYLTKIRCYIQFGKYGRAYGLLQKMAYYADVHKRTYIAMESKLLLAVVKYRIGEDGWQPLLQEVITQTEEYHFVRLLSREGGVVLKLLRAGSFQWKDEDFQKQVFQECERMEKYYPAYLKEKAAGDVVLSKNALNILRLQAEGYQAGEIARLLGITTNTVKYHNKEIYRRLRVSSKAAAVSEAKDRGLI